MSLIKQRLFYSGKFGDGLLQGDGIFAVSKLETVSAALPTMPTRGLAGKEHQSPRLHVHLQRQGLVVVQHPPREAAGAQALGLGCAVLSTREPRKRPQCPDLTRVIHKTRSWG